MQKESDSKLSSISKSRLALCILAKLNNLSNLCHIFYQTCLFQMKMQVYSFFSLYVLVFDICCFAFPASNPFNYVKIGIFLCRVISPKLSIHLFWVVLIQYPSYWIQKGTGAKTFKWSSNMGTVLRFEEWGVLSQLMLLGSKNVFLSDWPVVGHQVVGTPLGKNPTLSQSRNRQKETES